MRIFTWLVPAIFLAPQICATAGTVLTGAQIQVNPDQPIEMNTYEPGHIFPAHVVRDVYAGHGDLAIPQGSNAELIVHEITPGQMVLDLESVTVNETRYAMDAKDAQDQPRENRGRLLTTIVEASSKNGAPIETRGREIRLPADAVITFQLLEPLPMQ